MSIGNDVAAFALENPLNDYTDIDDSKKWIYALSRNQVLQQSHQKQHPFNLQLRKIYGIETIKRVVQIYIGDICKRWQSIHEEDDSDEEEDGDASMGTKQEEEAALRSEMATLQALGWHDLYRADILEVIRRVVDEHVRTTCEGEFETELLPDLQKWLEEVMLPFALALLNPSEKGELEEGRSYTYIFKSSGSTHMTSDAIWGSLSHWVLRALSLLRASELFDIVVDFPDSLVAAKEFKEASAASNSLGTVGKIFREAVTRRLLHSGASTAQIIDVYINMIRALRVIDASDLLLSFVGAPVREYLRRRKDTVRCVVSTLLQGRSSELHSEMRKGTSLEYAPDEDDEDRGPGVDWQPRQRDPDLADVSSKGTGLDVLALLISIYGSTDLFVNDYRALLADQLLQNLEYRADKDMATLELLKIRFGELSLHSCEVMLRDLEESRRINVALLKALKAPPSSEHAGVVDMLVLSEHYWPALPSNDEALTLAPQAQAVVDSYLNKFKEVKKPRHLTLAPQLGTVDLQLDFDDGSRRSFNVSPAQASTILFIAGNGEIPVSSDGRTSLEDLAKSLGVSEAEAHRFAAYWVNRGVLKQYTLTPEEATARDEIQVAFLAANGIQAKEEEPSWVDPFADSPDTTIGPSGNCVVFEIDEVQAARAATDAAKARRIARESGDMEVEGGDHDENNGDSMHGDDSDDDDTEGAGSALAAAAAAAERAAVGTYEGYIRGILSGHGEMELERLHTMLKLVMSGGSGEGAKFDMSILAFQRFLQGLIERDMLEAEDGVYRLRKPTG